MHATKSGLEDLDREALGKRIDELSKNSLFYQNQKKKEAKVQEKIQALIERKNSLHARDFAFADSCVKILMSKMEDERSIDSIYVHLDMDAFYAAVEMRDNAELYGKPIAVGGDSMLCTANYEARKFGVVSAMPGFIAKVPFILIYIESLSIFSYNST